MIEQCNTCKHKEIIDGIVGCLYMDADCQTGEMYEQQIKTNADRIRAMSDETLAERLYDICRGEVEGGIDLATNWCHDDCCDSEGCDPENHKACILRWLQQPVTETASI